MKKAKTPTAVITAVLTLITIIFWVGFELYRALTFKPTPPVPQTIINPLDPTLDTKALQSLQQRMFLNDTEIGNTQATSTIPTPVSSPTTPPLVVPITTPEATQSATPSASPQTTL